MYLKPAKIDSSFERDSTHWYSSRTLITVTREIQEIDKRANDGFRLSGRVEQRGDYLLYGRDGTADVTEASRRAPPRDIAG